MGQISSTPQQAPQPDPQTTADEIDAIKNVFTNMIADKTAYANKQIGQVQGIFTTLANGVSGEILDLTTDVNNENTAIDSQISTNKSLINNSGIVKFQYGKNELDILKYQNTILFSVFYILVLIFGGIMFYYDNINIILQTVVFHVLLVYPFIIYYLELLLFIIYKYTYSYFYSIPYENVYVGFG